MPGERVCPITHQKQQQKNVTWVNQYLTTLPMQQYEDRLVSTCCGYPNKNLCKFLWEFELDQSDRYKLLEVHKWRPWKWNTS